MLSEAVEILILGLTYVCLSQSENDVKEDRAASRNKFPKIVALMQNSSRITYTLLRNNWW